MFLILVLFLYTVYAPCLALDSASAQPLTARVSTPVELQLPHASPPAPAGPASPPSPLVAPTRNLSMFTILCDPRTYGDNANYESCYNAYGQIPHSTNKRRFGPRTSGNWDINLPWRIYSRKSV